MFAFKNIQETMRFTTLKIHQIIDKDYPCARKATTSFFAIKTSSELHQFASKSQKQNHCIRISETYFCKSRFSSYTENSSSSNLVTSLLKQSGCRQHNCMLDTFSPITSSLFNFHHRGKGASLKTHKILAIPHHGRDTTLMNIIKSKNILSGNQITADLIKNCWPCALRNKRFLKYPQGTIHSHGLPTQTHNPTFLSVHCDLAGPVKIKLTEGAETRHQKVTKAYIVVAVCSVTKAVCLAFTESRKLVHIARALRAICSRIPTPLYWICDQEGALCQLINSGEGKMSVIQENWGKVEEFKI